MGEQAVIGAFVLMIIVVIGMLFARALSRAAFPTRISLFELGEKLLSSPAVSAKEKRYVEYCLNNAMSFSAGWLVLRAGMRALRHTLSKANEAGPPLSEEMRSFGQRFIISALAANVVALVMFVPMMLVVMIVERERAKAAVADAAAYVPCEAATI